MFEEKIKELNQNSDLFYNSNGNPLAFKLGVKHLSFANVLLYTKVISNANLKVLKDFYLVDFEKKEIKEIKKDELLELISLESYED